VDIAMSSGEFHQEAVGEGTCLPPTFEFAAVMYTERRNR